MSSDRTGLSTECDTRPKVSKVRWRPEHVEGGGFDKFTHRVPHPKGALGVRAATEFSVNKCGTHPLQPPPKIPKPGFLGEAYNHATQDRANFLAEGRSVRDRVRGQIEGLQISALQP